MQFDFFYELIDHVEPFYLSLQYFFNSYYKIGLNVSSQIYLTKFSRTHLPTQFKIIDN